MWMFLYLFFIREPLTDHTTWRWLIPRIPAWPCITVCAKLYISGRRVGELSPSEEIMKSLTMTSIISRRYLRFATLLALVFLLFVATQNFYRMESLKNTSGAESKKISVFLYVPRCQCTVWKCLTFVFPSRADRRGNLRLWRNPIMAESNDPPSIPPTHRRLPKPHVRGQETARHRDCDSLSGWKLFTHNVILVS